MAWIWRIVLGLFAAFFVLYALACGSNRNDSSIAHDRGQRLLRTMPECPEVWQDIPISNDSLYRVPVTGLSVPGLTTNVPEFHDCQRFLPLSGVSAPNAKYDSLYAIFAFPGLDRIVDSVRALRIANVPQRAIAAAEVYTLGPGYSPLGIGSDFNCLYVYEGPNSRLEATMVHVGLNEQRCAAPIDPGSAEGKRLKVTVTPETGYTPRDYPTAARWDWSSENHQHYIGIRCGNAWCEIGDSTFSSSPQYPRGAVASEADPVVQIKGWYDEQYLAEISPLRPGPVKATIIPSPRLRGRSYAAGQWDSVAYVALDGPSPYYKQKFNFDPVAVSADLETLNQIHICYGTRRACGVPRHDDLTALSTFCGKLDRYFSRLPFWPQKLWWAKFTPAGGGTIMYRCITRRIHPSGTMGGPGTTRWRFLGDDETQWVDCRQGCCETQT